MEITSKTKQVILALQGRGLNPRQVEIALLAMRNIKSADIGERLGISPRTVKWHLNNIYRKTETVDRLHLAYVYNEGLKLV